METYNLEFLNKYKDLIRYRWKNPIINGIYEKHHIIPKKLCMNKIWVHSSTNIIKLTPKEHFYAHYYLWKAFPENKTLAIAAFLMCYGKRPYNKKIMDDIDVEYKSNEYDKLRKAYIDSMNERRQDIINKTRQTKIKNNTLHKPAWNKGIKGSNKHSEEYKIKLSKRMSIKENNPFTGGLTNEQQQKRIDTLKNNGKLHRPRKNKGYITISKDNITKQIKSIDELDSYIKDGWVRGNFKSRGNVAWNKGMKTPQEKIDKFRKSFGKRHWYHNPELKQCKTFKENEQPDGWILGRINY